MYTSGVRDTKDLKESKVAHNRWTDMIGAGTKGESAAPPPRLSFLGEASWVARFFSKIYIDVIDMTWYNAEDLLWQL